MSGGDGGGAAQPLRARVLALVAGGWATPDRLATAVRGLLDGGGLVEPSASAGEVVAVLERGARRAGQLAGPQEVAALDRQLAGLRAHLRIVDDSGYPGRLRRAWPELGAPLWVSVRSPDGRVPDGPAVAVVGTRHPTLDGLRTAEALGRLLARHGVVVVSGLARGIDQAAHRGALAADGPTVAVLGAGLAVDYPRGDGALRADIAAAGGLVTELAPHDPPRPRHFVARNRIISGLADAVVVVEGRARSGALATARLGAAQGRDVWAVPGSLHAPTSQAPLALLRDGAQLLTGLDDVLESVLGTERPPATVEHADEVAVPVARRLDPAGAAVLERLGPVPAAPAALAGAAGLELRTVLAALAVLDARRLAARTPRGWVRA